MTALNPETARRTLQSMRSYHEDTGTSDDEGDTAPMIIENDSNGPSRSSLKCAVWIMKAILIIFVTGCIVLSKLTIIKLLSNLHIDVDIISAANGSSRVSAPVSRDHGGLQAVRRVVNLYWQILFIIMVPNFLSWIYSIFTGLFSNSLNHPWPKKSAIIFGIINAGVEAVSECLLIFVVFVSLPPPIVILLMSGIFSIQGLLFVFSLLWSLRGNCCNNRYEPLEGIVNQLQTNKARTVLLVFLASTGVLLQFTGVIGFTISFVEQIKSATLRFLLGFLVPLGLLGLSYSWSNTVLKLGYKPSDAFVQRITRLSARIPSLKKASARWKSNFISTTVRLVVYPILSYLIVRYMYHLKDGTKKLTIDPWCIPYITELKIHEAFSWESHESAVFAVHIVASFVGYVLQRVACYTTLHVSGLALPIFLASPISLAIYFLSNSSVDFRKHVLLVLFPFTSEDAKQLSWSNTIGSEYKLAFGLIVIVWIGQILITAYNLLKSKNAILSSDEEMFVRPYYNSVFLEQYLAINRCVAQTPSQRTRRPCRVFICSTMFRENATEMKQLLCSLYRVAEFYKEQSQRDFAHDTFESHIFFDGGCHGSELTQFATQLISLVPGAMKVELEKGLKQETPYGYRFTWTINSCMPFMIHLKDNQKIKNKKRWSQVMYMNYVINHRAKKESMDLEHTFILTTDADIDFKPESAVTLLDMLIRDPQVGAVCARTYPLGFGLIYWYQLFDYAIGHWLQKAAEHILGSVLCCPGCFSMFRSSALKDCLQTYSSEVSSPIEFLMKDMGEDRWLCTLLVEKGWRLDYCAISKNYTYSPVEFDEFFKQRRRWIPSTMANLWLLISKGRKITSKSESIGWLFIIYQIFIIISTAIAPATVILIISSSLKISFKIETTAVLVILILISVIYGVICIYATQKTQLLVAKLLTFSFSIVMAIVVVGIIKAVIEDVAKHLQKPPNITMELFEDVQNHGFKFPVGETTIYISLFAFIFTVTAILHNKEFLTVFHCLWYLLFLPSGYLLLLIYSVANLNSRSWGTREASDNTQTVFHAMWRAVQNLLLTCMVKIGVTPAAKEEETHVLTESKEDMDDKSRERTFGGDLEETVFEGQRRRYDWLMEWLKKYGCEQFYEHFASEGYTEEFYVAEMSAQDLKDIGVRPEGYVRHLLKGIKKLCATPIEIGIPKNVHDWIVDLQMAVEDDYVRKFFNAGYFGQDDVENLPLITKEELTKVIGVTKKAHLKRFLQGISSIKISTPDQERFGKAQKALQLTNDRPNRPLDDDELAFWFEILDRFLYPVPESLTQTGNLKDGLNSLRNSVLIAGLLINLIWIILLYLLTIQNLADIGFDNKFLGLVFLVVYGIILLVQFIGMLFHRTVTLAHYIGRLNQSLPVEQTVEYTVGQTLTSNNGRFNTI